MSIGMRIAITGLILLGAGMLSHNVIGDKMPPMPVAIVIVTAAFGGMAAIVIGAIMAVWGV